MINYIDIFLHNLFGRNFPEFMGTFILFFVFFMIYSVALYLIKKREWTTDKHRRIAISTRNILFLFTLVAMIFIWSGEIKTMILSITALVAALLIAFKEIIMCFVGSIIIASNKLFALGDYIELDNEKCKVIDKNFLYTKLLISEPFQARELSIPNLYFINNKVINLSQYGQLQSNKMDLAIPAIKYTEALNAVVESIMDNVFDKYKENYEALLTQKKVMDIFFDMPQEFFHIEISITSYINPFLRIHFLCLPLDKSAIEKEITLNYTQQLETILKESLNEDKKL